MNYILSKHAIDVIANRSIEISWIDLVLENPSLVLNISTIEVHYFSSIIDSDNRCLKVVINPTTQVVITAYFDRKRRKKGCK